MHESKTTRVATMLKEAADAKSNPPESIRDLPGETHIVSGKLVGDGSASLASAQAHLSGKVVKLERTDDGGIEYQFAIFASEPTPPPALALTSKAEDPRFLAAVDYFVGKGKSDTEARKLVNQFGVDRVLARREKELDLALESEVSGE